MAVSGSGGDQDKQGPAEEQGGDGYVSNQGFHRRRLFVENGSYLKCFL
jgi:hypothetical protein